MLNILKGIKILNELFLEILLENLKKRWNYRFKLKYYSDNVYN